MKCEFKIDGVLIKNPNDFKIEDFNITNLTRTADGTMQGDLIKQSRKFYFTYNSITSQELKIIHNAIYGRKIIFFTLSYVDDNIAKTCKVYVGSIPRQLVRTDGGLGGNWVWKNFTFDLIEK